MGEADDVWPVRDRLQAELGVLEMDRRVHRICRYLRKDDTCKRCPMKHVDEALGREEVLQRLCYGLAAEVMALAHGALTGVEVRREREGQ